VASGGEQLECPSNVVCSFWILDERGTVRIARFQVSNAGHERPALLRNPRLHSADGLLSALVVVERAEASPSVM